MHDLLLPVCSAHSPARQSLATRTGGVKPTDRNSTSQLATPDSAGPAHLPPQTKESVSSEHLHSDKRPSLLDDVKDGEGGSEGVVEGGDGGRRGGGRSEGEGGEEAVSAKAPPIKKPRLMGPSLPPRQKRDKFEPQVSDETRPIHVCVHDTQ